MDKEEKDAEARRAERAQTRGAKEKRAPTKEQNSLKKFLKDVAENEPVAAWKVAKENNMTGDIIQEVVVVVIEAAIPEIIGYGVAKLAAMCNPVGAIVAAIKAIWDFIQFIRENAQDLVDIFL